jgi:serine/threonine-protein kinase
MDTGEERASDPIQAALEDYVEALHRGEDPDSASYLARFDESSARNRLRDLIGEVERVDRLLPEPAPPPARIGRFRISSELGRGGMGVVYRGWDDRDRVVAVKVLPDDVLLDELTRRRFEREVETLSRTQHPGVVRVIESGTENGRLFLAMECLEGGSLARRIHERRADPTPASDAEIRRACDVVQKVARAAAAAHAQGVVHRDIKPSNILFDDGGEPHLADFGLVHLEQASTLTTTERVLGTAAYMAPERLLDPTVAADPRVDVFSLGVTLFEAIAGVRPFQGKLPEIMAASRRGPPPLRILIGRSPGAGLDAILERSLADRPRARYRSADELADDLEAWLAGRPVAAESGARRRRAVRWIRLHPSRTAAAAFGLAVLAAFGGVRTVSAANAAARMRARVDEAMPHVLALEQAVNQRVNQIQARRALATNSWCWSGLPADGRVEANVLALLGEHPGFVDQARTSYFEPNRQRDEQRARAELALAAAVENLGAAHRLAPGSSVVRRELARVHRTAAEWFGHECWMQREQEQRERLRAVTESSTPSHPPASVELRVRPPDAWSRLLRYVEDEAGALALVEVGGGWSRSLGHDGLDAGSYVVELRRAETDPVTRYPVLLRWGEAHESDRFELPVAAELEGGWIYVPPGAFIAGGDLRASGGEPLEVRRVDGFFVRAREQTCAEYFEFLRDVRSRGERCLYGDIPESWTYDGPLHVPRDGTRSPPPYPFDVLLDARVGTYEPSAAAHSISPRDAQHYLRWLNERAESRGEPWVYALPSGDQWEKAARGVDGRSYPWGEGFDWSWTAGGLTRILFEYDESRHMQPGRFALDTSPYGLLDTAGNVREFCADWEPITGRFLVRGGEESFYSPDDFRLAGRRGALENETNWDFGLRLIRTRRE